MRSNQWRQIILEIKHNKDLSILYDFIQPGLNPTVG